MKTRKDKLQRLLEAGSVSSQEVFGDFTEAQVRIVNEEIRHYDLLKALREMRRELKLSQRELAQRASLPRSSISKIESGNYNPTVRTLMSIAAAMNKKLEVRLV